jgi:hypothetical protein
LAQGWHRIRRRVGYLILGLAVLLATAVPVMAAAPEAEPAVGGAPGQDASGPSPASVAAAYQAYVREGEERKAELEEPRFVAEREQSRHNYDAINTGEAEELLMSTAARVAVLGVLIASPIAGSGTASATARSTFCNPHGTLQSFGGRPVQGFVAHLAVAPGYVRPGAIAEYRIVNEGTDELTEDSVVRVQRWTGNSWVRMPEPGDDPSFGAGIFVQPRSVTECYGASTGRHWRPGRYRFLLEVRSTKEIGGGPQPKVRWLHAPFLIRR